METFINAAMYIKSTLIIVPLIAFCFFPVRQDAKSSPKHLFIKVISSFAATEAFMYFLCLILPPAIADLVNTLLCVAVFFYLYQKEIALDRSHLWFIFMTACMLGGFAYLFYHMINIFLHPSSILEDPVHMDTFFFQLMFETILVFILYYPSTKYLGWLVHHFHEEKVWKIIWLVPAGFLAFAKFFIPYDNSIMYQNRFLELYITTLAVLTVLIISIYILFYKIAHSITENRQILLKTANLELQAQQYHRLQTYMQETSRLRHDFRYQLTVLAEMLKKQNYSELEDYLNQYIISVSGMPVRYCTSSAVNAILNHYTSLCRELDIPIRMNIRLLEKFAVEDIDFCVLLGNLLENAVDACKTLPENERQIDLRAGQTAEHVIALKISNPYSTPLILKGNRLFSSKHEGEGQGLKSVRLIAEKYDGYLDISYKNQLFEVKVLLNF